jgi:hypothetical protein
MIDTPGGVPTADCKVCGRKGGHMGGVPTEHTHIINDPMANEAKKSVEEVTTNDDNEIRNRLAVEDQLQTEFMNFWDEYKPKVGLGDYSDEITRFWFGKMEIQKAEIISLIMGMETKDKGRESDEFDQGMEIMRAKIINKIRTEI